MFYKYKYTYLDKDTNFLRETNLFRGIILRKWRSFFENYKLYGCATKVIKRYKLFLLYNFLNFLKPYSRYVLGGVERGV